MSDDFHIGPCETFNWVKIGTLNQLYSEIQTLAERYTFNWNTFADHLQLMFKAHKIVLGACSPVFKKIINNTRLFGSNYME